MPTKTEEFQMKLECVWTETQASQTSFPLADLKSMLDQVGLDLPNYKVRALTEELKCSNRATGNNLSKQEFVQVSYSQSVCLSAELTHCNGGDSDLPSFPM